MRPSEPTNAVARRIVDANMYMTIATADADGRPWVSPVWYAPVTDSEFLWVSAPEARHSRNIAARPEVAIVIFDSTVPVGAAEAVYLPSAIKAVGSSYSWSLTGQRIDVPSTSAEKAISARLTVVATKSSDSAAETTATNHSITAGDNP